MRTYALSPEEADKSLAATRDTRGKPALRLIDVSVYARALLRERRFVVVGGVAQVLFGRKSHTDDLDLAVTAPALAKAYREVAAGEAPPGWALPPEPFQALEENSVIKVCHLQFRGAVVDLIAFKNPQFSREVLATSTEDAHLHARLVRPELLLVMHLLRPTPQAQLDALALLVEQAKFHKFRYGVAEKWATLLGKKHAYHATLKRAKEILAQTSPSRRRHTVRVRPHATSRKRT